MQAYLKKHGPSFSNHRLKVNWEKLNLSFTVEFSIQKRTGPGWQTDSSFSSDWLKNWGLWNKDVFEAFLQLRSRPDDLLAPYLEIQVSPLNQPFALIITEPRKTYFPPLKIDLVTTVDVSDKFWNGKMVLNLPEELKGTMLYGGFFSCLATDPREFYALEPNPEVNPDFHRPELFLPLEE
jgi:hypothetical protein